MRFQRPVTLWSVQLKLGFSLLGMKSPSHMWGGMNIPTSHWNGYRLREQTCSTKRGFPLSQSLAHWKKKNTYQVPFASRGTGKEDCWIAGAVDDVCKRAEPAKKKASANKRKCISSSSQGLQERARHIRGRVALKSSIYVLGGHDGSSLAPIWWVGMGTCGASVGLFQKGLSAGESILLML